MAKSHGALPDPLSHAHDTRANAEALPPALPIATMRPPLTATSACTGPPGVWTVPPVSFRSQVAIASPFVA